MQQQLLLEIMKLKLSPFETVFETLGNVPTASMPTVARLLCIVFVT